MRDDAPVSEHKDTTITFDEYVDRYVYGTADAGATWGRAPQKIGGDEYADLVTAFREVQDSAARARLDETESAYITGRLQEIAARLDTLKVAPEDRTWSHRYDLIGRGSPFPPQVSDGTIDPVHGRLAATVTFGASYVGAADATHGGAMALIFDEMLGMCVNAGRPPSRTAYLHVDYRSICPLDTPLDLTVSIDRIEGRKRFVVAQLKEGDRLIAEAESLFVELRPGQK